MAEPHISYVTRTDTTPEGELNALTAVYRIVLNSRKENAASVTSTDGDDAKGSRHEVRANEASIPR